jgi:integrase
LLGSSLRWARSAELTKTQAKRLGAQWLYDQGVNTSQHLQQPVVPTFDGALEKWREACLVNFKPSGRDTTKYIVGKHIEPRFKGLRLEEVNKQAVQLWINDLKESGLAPKSVSNIVKALKSILNWAEVGTRDWKLRLPQIPEEEQRWFTSEEVMRIIEAAEGQYRALFRLAYASGCRPGELFGMHVEDFDFKKGTVRVRRSTYRNLETTPKTSSGWRTIYIDRVTSGQVKKLLGNRTTGRVFMTRNGTPLKDGEVCRSVLTPICETLGIEPGGMHAFRHGRVSRMDEMGISDKVKMVEIGHSTLRMTRKYTHVSDERRREIAQKLAL